MRLAVKFNKKLTKKTKQTWVYLATLNLEYTLPEQLEAQSPEKAWTQVLTWKAVIKTILCSSPLFMLFHLTASVIKTKYHHLTTAFLCPHTTFSSLDIYTYSIHNEYLVIYKSLDKE